MATFFYDRIVCPYCLGKGLHEGVFSHKDVHFRMETCFEEEELNDEGKKESEVRRMPEGPEKARLLAQIAERKPFLAKESDSYKNFWQEFGGTTEVAYGMDKDRKIKPWQLPILDPSNPEHRRLLASKRSAGGDPRDDYFLYDGDGMVIGVEDIHGHETYRRVCPKCHNPLAAGYGKFETKFISVIGITQSGKTVFLSQLLKTIFDYTSHVGLSSYFSSDHENSFVNANPVEAGKALPAATVASRFTQPMYYDLVRRLPGDRRETNTIVLYDIAGENCVRPQEMAKFGRFIIKSDGIIMLLDPGQLGFGALEDTGEKPPAAQDVFNAIYKAFQEVKSENVLTVPMAVCISKSDKVKHILPTESRCDIKHAQNPRTGSRIKAFNASEYNILQKSLTEQIEGNCEAVHELLCNNYKYFNYFAFSATGCAVEKRDGKSYPVEPPNPQRIAEPLLWLFYRFGYISSDVPIRLPFPLEEKIPRWVEIQPTGPFAFLQKPKKHYLTEDEIDREKEKEQYWYEPYL